MNKNLKKSQRLAKAIASSGHCSRREAESLIKDNKVKVNGVIINDVSTNITDESIKINNKLINKNIISRLWIFHKPKGYITTNFDPSKRATIFDILPSFLPRVITIGRLDINTEGLLLLTNDSNIARYIENSKWVRKYRARLYGRLNMNKLKIIEKGIKIDNISYEPVKINLEVERKFNSWINLSLTEGKNREIKKIMTHFGLDVTRLIRVSFGTINLGSLAKGEVKEIKIKDVMPKKIYSSNE